MHKKTQVCLPHHGDKLIEIDEEFEFLLHELNVMGLRTTDHCAGDKDDETDSYLAFDMEECDVWARRLNGEMRVVLRWNRYGRKLYGRDGQEGKSDENH